MYHSIYIGSKNTWEDFHLVANERPSVKPPEVSTVYVDIAGVDGSLDLTTALTGSVMYKNREGSWEFTVANWYEPWDQIYHKLMNYLHGKKHIVRLEDEPQYYYVGRLSVNEWKSDKINSTITINYNFEPYKYEPEVGDWLWDPFRFDTDLARDGYSSLLVSNARTVVIPGSQRPCVPEFIVTDISSMVMVVNNETDSPFQLSMGSNRFPQLVIRDSDMAFTFIVPENASGRISIVYKGGWL